MLLFNLYTFGTIVPQMYSHFGTIVPIKLKDGFGVTMDGESKT